jgi:hypothetical protein
LPQISQLKVSVQVNGGTPSLGWTFLMKVAYISERAQSAIFCPQNTRNFHIS